jgi:hypothetical protein
LGKTSERNAQALAAEILAVRTVIEQVLGRVHQLDPILGDAIESGIRDAAVQIRRMSTYPGKRISARQAARAFAEVEVLHLAILRRSHRRVRTAFANDNR